MFQSELRSQILKETNQNQQMKAEVDTNQMLEALIQLIHEDIRLYSSEKHCFEVPEFPESHVIAVANQVKQIFKTEHNILLLHSPMTIVGDLHGNMFDLFRIFRENGIPPHTRYLFLGDIVDRGEFSLECILFIFLLKIHYPKHIYVIRGNHEFHHICAKFGFKAEIESHYKNLKAFFAITKAFNFIPYASVIDDSLLCVHAGIGPFFTEVSQLNSLSRPQTQFSKSLPTFDLFWSDPSPSTAEYSKSPRNFGHLFGEKPLAEFLERNNLALIIRGHEMASTGVQFLFDRRVVTVFSSSNYCQMGNDGGILVITPGHIEVRVFKPFPIVPHGEQIKRTPYVELFLYQIDESGLIYNPNPNWRKAKTRLGKKRPNKKRGVRASSVGPIQTSPKTQKFNVEVSNKVPKPIKVAPAASEAPRRRSIPKIAKASEKSVRLEKRLPLGDNKSTLSQRSVSNPNLLADKKKPLPRKKSSHAEKSKKSQPSAVSALVPTAQAASEAPKPTKKDRKKASRESSRDTSKDSTKEYSKDSVKESSKKEKSDSSKKNDHSEKVTGDQSEKVTKPKSTVPLEKESDDKPSSSAHGDKEKDSSESESLAQKTKKRRGKKKRTSRDDTTPSGEIDIPMMPIFPHDIEL